MSNILLLYPGKLLRAQAEAWAFQQPVRNVAVSFDCSLPGIRHALVDADAAIIDATIDYPQAIDAYLQAIAKLGAGAVLVYTEIMHDGLELFVRRHGSLVLLGPSLEDDDAAFAWASLQRKTTRRFRDVRHSFLPSVFG